MLERDVKRDRGLGREETYTYDDSQRLVAVIIRLVEIGTFPQNCIHPEPKQNVRTTMRLIVPPKQELEIMWSSATFLLRFNLLLYRHHHLILFRFLRTELIIISLSRDSRGLSFGSRFDLGWRRFLLLLPRKRNLIILKIGVRSILKTYSPIPTWGSSLQPVNGEFVRMSLCTIFFVVFTYVPTSPFLSPSFTTTLSPTLSVRFVDLMRGWLNLRIVCGDPDISLSLSLSSLSLSLSVRDLVEKIFWFFL